MGVLTRAIGIYNYTLEDPAQPLLPMSALMESLGIGKSDAGINVNEKQAMRMTTAYACINNIAADLSGLPLPVLQRMPDGSIREATEHRMYPIIQTTPNRNMTSMVYRGSMLAAVLGWGNSYSYIRRDNAARVVELLPLPSECTSPVLIPAKPQQAASATPSALQQRKLMYATTATPDQLPSYIDPENILHISGLSYDGYVGMSPIQTCKNAFGIGLAAERFGAQFFGNGAKASGVLSHPGTLGTEAFENLKKSIREIISGENALRPLVLEEGMKWEQTTINPNDAQFLETRNFQREEVAALYRMPMHLLQSLQRATNNNIEHQSLDYIRTCLRMWAVRIEQEINRKLLSEPYFVEHDFNAFQRGDYQSQVNGIVSLRNAGIFHANDAMRQLRLNPIPVDEGGDVRLVPLNMVPLTQVAQESNAGGEANGAGDGAESEGENVITDSRGARVVKAYRRLFRDALGRIANRTKFDDAFAYKALQPVVASMAEATMAMYFTPDEEMKDRAETEATRITHDLIASLKVKYEGNLLATIAVAITDEAYAALYKALIG
jgi:HK97 family phage portal protein